MVDPRAEKMVFHLLKIIKDDAKMLSSTYMTNRFKDLKDTYKKFMEKNTFQGYNKDRLESAMATVDLFEFFLKLTIDRLTPEQIDYDKLVRVMKDALKGSNVETPAIILYIFEYFRKLKYDCIAKAIAIIYARTAVVEEKFYRDLVSQRRFNILHFQTDWISLSGFH